MRKTKVICTIGPASENEEVLRKLVEEGMAVARMNFSHGTHEEHRRKFELVKKVRADLRQPIAIMLDTNMCIVVNCIFCSFPVLAITYL